MSGEYRTKTLYFANFGPIFNLQISDKTQIAILCGKSNTSDLAINNKSLPCLEEDLPYIETTTCKKAIH